jgi:hypothetical protein
MLIYVCFINITSKICFNTSEEVWYRMFLSLVTTHKQFCIFILPIYGITFGFLYKQQQRYFISVVTYLSRLPYNFVCCVSVYETYRVVFLHISYALTSYNFVSLFLMTMLQQETSASSLSGRVRSDTQEIGSISDTRCDNSSF